MFVKSDEDITSGYVRHTMQTKDESASVSGDQGTFIRRIRNYYTLAHASRYHWYRTRCDFSMGKTFQREDGFRYYLRLYKNDQRVLMDGPTIVEGTNIGNTFIHRDGLNLEFWWMPTFGFVDFVGDDFEIARVSYDANNYIAIELVGGLPEREYNLNDVLGPHDPKIRARKVRAGVEVDRVEVGGCYYGYVLGDPSLEPIEDPIRIQLVNQAAAGMGLRVERNTQVGENFTVADTASFGVTGNADLIYNGAGWYGRPTLKNIDDFGGRSVIRRKLPHKRADVARRSFGRTITAALAGEQDSTNGQRIRRMPFIETDDFTTSGGRPAGGGLGSDSSGFLWSSGFDLEIHTPKLVSDFARADVLNGTDGPYDLNALNLGGDVSFNIALDGGGPQSIVFSSSNPRISDFSSVTADEVTAVINSQLTGGRAITDLARDSKRVHVRSDDITSAARVLISAGISDANAALNFPTALTGPIFRITDADPAVPPVATSWDIIFTVDGGSAPTVTLTSGDFTSPDHATITEMVDAINLATTGLTAAASASGTAITVSSDTSGTAADIKADPGTVNPDANTILGFGTTLVDGAGLATCQEAGFRYWNGRRPRHADVIIQATARIDNTGDLVGLMQRVDLDGVSSRDEVFGYGAEVIQNSVSTADLRIVLFWNDTRTVLATKALANYSQEGEMTLIFKPQGSALAAEVYQQGADPTDPTQALATLTVVHDMIKKSGRIGMYGETGGAGQKVAVDNWTVQPNFVDTLD
jgi:hypothetical protein